MTRTGWIVVVVASAALVGPASPAAARQPDPPQPTTEAVVRLVEVPVPVPTYDRATEAVHMIAAAAFGAALAAGATATCRGRRRPSVRSAVIDITELVQQE